MEYSIFIRQEAESDLKEIYKWYESCQKGLGGDFKYCIEETINKLKQTPQTYPTVHKNIRRAFIRRFPFGIFYLVENNSIIVLAILHPRRDPRKWKERT
jgi:plasmid stabilization system protein ParE